MDKLVDINWGVAGATLAVLSDEKQGLFFEAFAKELANYPTHFTREMQMHFISDKLSVDAKKILSEYLPCLWFQESSDE